MTDEDRIEYAKTRMEHALQCLDTAKLNVENNDYKSAANRSYYAVFHSMRSVIALSEIEEQSKHQGVIRTFRKEYIRTGIFPERLSETITSSFEIRNECDYDDFYIISKDEVREQIERAEEFVGAIRQYLVSKGVFDA